MTENAAGLLEMMYVVPCIADAGGERREGVAVNDEAAPENGEGKPVCQGMDTNGAKRVANGVKATPSH